MGSDRPIDKPRTAAETPPEMAVAGNSLAARPATSTLNLAEREEQRKIRRLDLMMNMVIAVIGQDESLSVDEAAEMIADTRKAALAMFPDKELAYNLIYKPRLQRLMRERFRIQ